jgi:hypothetical protein
MKLRKLLICSAALLVVTLAVWLSLHAIGPEAPPFEFVPQTQPPGERLRLVRELGIPSFTNKVPVYHSAGYETRAQDLATLIEDALRVYEDKLKIRPDFSVAVLTRPDWERVEKGTPFGLPSVSPPPHVVLLPATHDGVVLKDLLARRGKASPTTLRMLEQSGFSFEQGAEKFVDLISLHELGHVLTLAYGIRPPSRWANEFFATYFGFAYLRQAHPRLATLFVAMTSELQYRDADKPRYTSLEDFDRLYSQVGSANYGWYQSSFVGRVAQVYDLKQLTFLEEVRTAYPQGTSEGQSPRAVLERLEQICPGFVTWGESLK